MGVKKPRKWTDTTVFFGRSSQKIEHFYFHYTVFHRAITQKRHSFQRSAIDKRERFLNPCSHSRRGRGQGRRLPRTAVQERRRERRAGAHEVVRVLPLLPTSALLALQRLRPLRGGQWADRESGGDWGSLGETGGDLKVTYYTTRSECD